jgi:hypothetical protein
MLNHSLLDFGFLRSRELLSLREAALLKYLLIAKLVLMSLALVFVLWTMKVIDAKAISKVFATLGLESGTTGSGAGTLKLCRSRVQSLIWPDGRKIEERVDGLKMDWMAHDPSPRLLNYLDMEKWLSQHCEITTQGLQSRDRALSAYLPFLTIKFVDGSTLQIQQSPGEPELFLIDHQLVRSGDLLKASNELAVLAQFTKAGSGPKAP